MIQKKKRKKFIHKLQKTRRCYEKFKPQAFKIGSSYALDVSLKKKTLSESLLYSLAVWYATVKHIFAYPVRAWIRIHILFLRVGGEINFTALLRSLLVLRRLLYRLCNVASAYRWSYDVVRAMQNAILNIAASKLRVFLPDRNICVSELSIMSR